MIPFIGEIAIGVALLVISSLSAYIFRYFKHKKRAIYRNKERIDEIEDEIKNIKRVLVILAKNLDKGSKKYHNDIDSGFEELIKDLLTDEILPKYYKSPV